MSITDELRKWGRATLADTSLLVRMEAIADRIDAEHQKALDEWKAKHGQMWLKGYSECHAELLEGNETLASDLERCGWIRLPKDADGEYIRIRDVLDGYGKTIEVVELRYGRSGWVIISRDGNGYVDTFAFTHHKPTVEDVLRDACKAYHSLMVESMSDVAHDMPAPSEVIAKYAKLLTLAEGEDA